MINSIIKILNKLNDNIEKYNVVSYYYKDEPVWEYKSLLTTLVSEVQYTINNVSYRIGIYNDYVMFYQLDSTQRLHIPYSDELSKLEVNKLVLTIHNKCQDNLRNCMLSFANSSEDEEID